MSELIGYLSEVEHLKGELTIPKVVGGGGGDTPVIESLSVTPTTSQQTYNDSEVDGYKPVVVNPIPPEYIVPTGTKNITQNGQGIDVAAFASANVNVPNSYSASDEGKVVDGGALVAQTTHADVTPTTSDQTIDTTTNNSIKVKGDADLVAANIKKDVEIFGVTGSYEGGGGGGAGAVVQDQDGYLVLSPDAGGGGTDLSWLGATTPTPSVRNFFAALANGTAEHGEFTLASTPNNAFVDLFTLTNITAPPQGIIFIDKDFYQGISGLANNGSEACSLFWFDKSFLNPAKVGSADYVATKIAVNQTGTTIASVAPTGQFVILDGNTAVFRGKWQFTGGTFQCKFEFNNSDQYTPFLRGRTYIWVAY